MAEQRSGDRHIPVDIQYLVLESADWTDHPVLAQVCSTWRNFLRTSNKALDKRYQPISDASLMVPPYSRFSVPRIHRALSDRHLTLRSGYEFEVCRWVPLGTNRYQRQGIIHEESAAMRFFSNDPALKPSSEPGNHIDIITRRADMWFQRNFQRIYPMSCNSMGPVPKVGSLLSGACEIAREGYTGEGHHITLLRYWAQSFYEPVVLGLSWRAQYISEDGLSYVDFRFDIQEIGMGKVQGLFATLLRGIPPFFISWTVVFVHRVLTWWTTATPAPGLHGLAPLPNRGLFLASIGGILALVFISWYLPNIGTTTSCLGLVTLIKACL
ncbi:hypothetical protein TWF481_010257 [Arthrobotrys musiformis]|uniref:F-box domain-containing protein n=1 Tax=Arthrobotrys musiformis TaxID=47236 RepID=A0AAV9W0C1_9PEZI